MFEDNPNTPQPPANLPFGQPQSPFVNAPPAAQPSPADFQPQAQPQPQTQFAPAPAFQPAPASNVAPAAPVEDMFSATEKPSAPGGIAQQYNQRPSYPSGPQISETDLFGGGGIPWGRIITIIIIVLVVILAIGAAIWGYSYISGGLKNKAPVAPAAEQPSATVPAAAVPEPPASAVETPAAATSAPASEDNKDSDGDGLTNVEENALGADALKADTDADGLTDWAEVKIYHSDPLNPDTDGDGYKDGAEVINGYDPLKPGSARLYAVPAATSTK